MKYPRPTNAPRASALFTLLDETIPRKGPYRDSIRTANNTHLLREDDTIALRFHNTRVVRIYADGAVSLHLNGWYTNTTLARVNGFLSQYADLIGGKRADGARPFRVHKDYRPTSESGIPLDARGYLLSRFDPKAKRPPRTRRVYRVRYDNAWSENPASGIVVREEMGNPAWSDWDHVLTIRFPFYDSAVAAEKRERAKGNYYSRGHVSSWALTRSIPASSHTFLRTIVDDSDDGAGAYVSHEYFDGITIGPRGKVSEMPRQHYRKSRPQTIGQYCKRARGPFYKVLREDLRAPFQPNYQWKVGAWQRVKGPLEPCANGLHCATQAQLAKWLDGTWPNQTRVGTPILTSRVFVAHTRGPVYDAGEKCLTRSLKIGRELEPWEVFARISLPLPATIETREVAS